MLGRMIAGGTTIDVLINALEQQGLVRTLAEPNLVALSGDTASFLAGGEYPDPGRAERSSNQITVEWKRYGVGLAFTPTVLNDGLINLKIEPEVSQLDPNNQIPVGAGLPPIPAIIVRRAATTIELRDGQSFMIGGLLQNESQGERRSRFLGSAACRCSAQLFASRSYQKKETDLAIIVTPRLVRPARPGDVIKTPLDNTLPANDADFFLTGKPSSPRDRSACAARPWRCRSAATSSICRREAPMSSQSGTKAVAAAASCSASALAGCSDIYYDRRETIALGAGDAVATNKVTQMVDPWPRHSANNHIAFNGELHAGGAGALQPRQGDHAGAADARASKDYQAVQQAAASQQSATGQSHVGDAGGARSKGPRRSVADRAANACE